tara:strand:- start:13833 stop:14171 length:339 start_codon:yes stop_codon:yes gene_type:complete
MKELKDYTDKPGFTALEQYELEHLGRLRDLAGVMFTGRTREIPRNRRAVKALLDNYLEKGVEMRIGLKWMDFVPLNEHRLKQAWNDPEVENIYIMIGSWRSVRIMNQQITNK